MLFVEYDCMIRGGFGHSLCFGFGFGFGPVFQLQEA